MLNKCGRTHKKRKIVSTCNEHCIVHKKSKQLKYQGIWPVLKTCVHLNVIARTNRLCWHWQKKECEKLMNKVS
jgi:hypothetical protein